MSESSASTFGSDKQPLKDLLSNIGNGKIQLPDFQRGWVWDDDHIKSLLASLSRSFPVGTIMLLQNGSSQVKFKPRLVEGVKLTELPAPENLILDGQQRLTSLFQSLVSGNVVATRDARKKKINRWYYIDMIKALDPSIDREDAIISLPENRKIVNFRSEVIEDYSTQGAEFAAHLFPVARIFNASDWRIPYEEFWDYKREKIALFSAFEKEVIKRIEQYYMPVITLYKDTPKEAVCQVFEKVNTGGVSLTVFELLTASFAADDFELRKDWENREKRLRKYPVLQAVQSDDFLQGIALLTTLNRRNNSVASSKKDDDSTAISCKRKDILALQHEDYLRAAEVLTQGFEKAARLLRSQKIFFARDLPYRTQLVPLATVFAVLGEAAEKDNIRTKLVRWYWCGVLGELYSSAVETRFAKDVPEILSWIDDSSTEPTTVQDSAFYPNRLMTLKSRNSAAYKGISALLLRDDSDGLDFFTGESVSEQMYAEANIDIHHIFPADWCNKNGIDVNRRDCIINKTPLSAKTNRRISNNAPSIYVKSIEREVESPTRMDKILRSHVIDPASLRADQFNQFFDRRKQALLERIEQAMGKTIPRDIPADFEKPEDFDEEIEAQPT